MIQVHGIAFTVVVVGYLRAEETQVGGLLISDVNIAFQQAAGTILLENESLLQRFSLELKTCHDAGRYWEMCIIGPISFVAR